MTSPHGINYLPLV
ncbi:MAG: CRISPR-associated DxTHG motif protein [Actinobacteria bacterium]|nr:CRISPR-associated DxTHG motif protein [Actinomycetota bacterium]